MDNEIYLDHAATTYVDPRVKKVMDKFFTEEFGNPGSFNSVGLRAKDAMDKSRETVASILNCKPIEIIFTGSGTESINLALQGIAKANKNKGRHIITTKVEHPAVLSTCEYLEKEGFDVTYLDVDKYGMVSVEDVKKTIRDDTILVSIIYANNEIGSVNDIATIGKFLKENHPTIYFHSDGCQAGCSLNVNVKELNVDLFTLNGSKIYGPKGIGLLYLKRGVVIMPLIYGGGQENRLRSGTQNVPGIVGFSEALKIAQQEKEYENQRLKTLRDKLINGIIKNVSKSFLNGHPTQRLANNANITILDVEGEALMLYLNQYGICASSGSACTSHKLEPSHVITAIGLPYEAAHGSLRFTLGRRTVEKDIDKVIEVLPGIVDILRKLSPVKLELNEVIN